MDFNLSKEELLVQQMLSSFAENEVKPLAQEVDEEERFPAETVKKMAKLGMMGMYIPKEHYGGQAPLTSALHHGCGGAEQGLRHHRRHLSAHTQPVRQPHL